MVFSNVSIVAPVSALEQAPGGCRIVGGQDD